jgi:hypothetical protein
MLPRLRLHQELYLIAHGEDGRPLIHLPTLQLGLASAVLLDLVLAERIEIHSGELYVHDTEPLGYTVVDTVIPALLRDRKHRDLREWLRSLAEDSYDRSCASLVALGLLARVTRRRLGLVPRNRYQPTGTGPTVIARASVRYAVEGRERPDAQCAALCGLVAVLRLGDALYVDLPGTQIQELLRRIVSGHVRSVREIVAVTDALAGDLAVAVYR